MENSWLLSAAVVTSCSPIHIDDREMHKTLRVSILHLDTHLNGVLQWCCMIQIPPPKSL